MTMRTTKTTVTFTRPFSLSGFEGLQPAGSYSVETDEELLDGVSFPAYRRMATMMQLPAITAKAAAGAARQVAVIDPLQLEAALAADVAPGSASDQVAELYGLTAPGRAERQP